MRSHSLALQPSLCVFSASLLSSIMQIDLHNGEMNFTSRERARASERRGGRSGRQVSPSDGVTRY
jgi:hypothetical protein